MDDMPMPQNGLAALEAAADSGELDELYARHRVRILTVFGSTARGEPTARDLDIGVMFEPDADPDYLKLINDLIDLIKIETVDFAHLNRCPGLRTPTASRSPLPPRLARQPMNWHNSSCHRANYGTS
jgi:predicted nucleotidyltransferase